MFRRLLPIEPTDENAALIAELRPALVAYFQRRCRDAVEAEDLAQDVLLRALNRAKWNSVEEAQGYIFRIAANRWKDRGRRRLTHGVELEWDEEKSSATEGITAERVITGEVELQKVLETLPKLSQRERDVLILCRFEQMKKAEVGEILGISVSAVEKHLVNVLAYLAARVYQDE
jgi:RNA polymerase sigma-70 factor (ECF subfamily)